MFPDFSDTLYIYFIYFCGLLTGDAVLFLAVFVVVASTGGLIFSIGFGRNGTAIKKKLKDKIQQEEKYRIENPYKSYAYEVNDLEDALASKID